jgi:hypothetical protein
VWRTGCYDVGDILAPDKFTGLAEGVPVPSLAWIRDEKITADEAADGAFDPLAFTG